MASDVDALVKDAIRAVKAGKKAEARLLLERATDADPENEQAWMWMSAVVEDPADQRICLENVLYINPDSSHAKKGLDILKEKHPEVFVEGDPEPEAAPPQESSWDAPVTATSSASSVFVPDEQPPPDVYDDWVAGLNLGGDDSTGELDDDSGPLFNNLDFMGTFDDNDDSASLRLDNIESGGAFTSDVFSSTDFSTGVDEQDDDDLLAEFDLDDGSSSDDLLGDPLLDDFDDELLDSFEMDSPMSPGESLSGSAFATDDYDDVGDEHDPSVYFDTIPDDIVPTRIPGTNESYPVLVILGLLVLLLLNIGAAGFLAMNIGA